MPRKPRTRSIHRSDPLEVWRWLQHYVCFSCRKTFKKSLPSRRRLCPQCQQPMTNMGTDFKAPPQKDGRQWRKVQALARAGVYFFPREGDDLPGEAPATLAEVPGFLERRRLPSEGDQLRRGPPPHSPAHREGHPVITGHAPQLQIFLMGRPIRPGTRLELWHHGEWRAVSLGAGGVCHLAGPDQVVPLSARSRLRWPSRVE